MVTSFESRLVNFTGPVSALADTTSGNTLYPGTNPTYRDTVPETVALAYYKPVMMNYFVFNPCNATIALDVEVWCWRRGFAKETSGLQDTYFNGFEYASEDVSTQVLYQGDERTYALSLPPTLHGVPVLATGVNASNARKQDIRQLHDVTRLRMRCMKLLSRRKQVMIPAGRIFKFRVLHRLPNGLPVHVVSGYAGYGQAVDCQRLVVLKWHTLMGTVPGELESSHLSEKVHIVVARRCNVRGTFVNRVPNIKGDLVYQHDGTFPAGTNYVGTLVNEHLAVQEVTKTTQNLEQVP